MKLFKQDENKKSSLLPFYGTPHVNSQRHLRGAGRFISKRHMAQQATYLLSINHVQTSSRFLAPSIIDELKLKYRNTPRSHW
ncbi:MAG: hypothetical protein KDD70_00365 [Bdellovibrionales bacterium]|nr:hypothetical protein [Bdellovibrionales bacterium]